MPVAVVFALAVADGLSPVVGAAPYDVLARQLPRLLVARLNGTGDRGIRFFPFLATVDGRRSFLRLNESLTGAALRELHRQGDLALLCDGAIDYQRLSWRAIDAATGETRLALDVAYDPRRPLDVLPRLEFELAGLLGWSGRPRAPLALTGEALGWFLVLKDQVLAREAKLEPDGGDPLRAVRRGLELAPEDTDMQAAIVDYAAQLVPDATPAGLGELLAQLTASATLTETLLERLAALLLAVGDEDAAATAAMRAALLAPERSELVERAAALLFRRHRLVDVRAVVELARARGVASPAALAQLAVVCDGEGDRATRSALLAELLALPDLPIPVARLVVSFLLEEDRPAEARSIAERALVQAPAHAMLHFELGRACLQLHDDVAARAAFLAALERGLPGQLVPQARRFAAMARVPGVWGAVQRTEAQLGAGDPRGALREIRGAITRLGHQAELWYLVGVIRHRLEQGRRARHAYQRALRLDAEMADAHNRLGILLVGMGRLGEGHAHLERAHELAPGEASPLLHLAQACALLGRARDAERHIAAAAAAGAAPELVAAVRREIG